MSREGSSRMDSPAAKPYEAVAHMGACSSSAGNGQEGNNVSSLLIKPSLQSNILMADFIPSNEGLQELQAGEAGRSIHFEEKILHIMWKTYG
jgi:hypothetical protein